MDWPAATALIFATFAFSLAVKYICTCLTHCKLMGSVKTTAKDSKVLPFHKRHKRPPETPTGQNNDD